MVTRPAIVLILLAACGPKVAIGEQRMVHAPARDAGCGLEFVQVDITSVTFNQQWEVLGYVTLHDRGTQDPMAEENRGLVRPRACGMGGTAVAIAQSAQTETALATGSAVQYMVLRPKPTGPAAPTAF